MIIINQTFRSRLTTVYYLGEFNDVTWKASSHPLPCRSRDLTNAIAIIFSVYYTHVPCTHTVHVLLSVHRWCENSIALAMGFYTLKLRLRDFTRWNFGYVTSFSRNKTSRHFPPTWFPHADNLSTAGKLDGQHTNNHSWVLDSNFYLVTSKNKG